MHECKNVNVVTTPPKVAVFLAVVGIMSISRTFYLSLSLFQLALTENKIMLECFLQPLWGDGVTWTL